MNKILFMVICLIPVSGLSQDWLTDFEMAKSKAQKEEKAIILVFQGSDWCAPCIKLDREIWHTEEFQNYAKDNYVMLQVDFPKRKKNALTETQQEHNNKLAEQYNRNGYFPYVVVLDFEGNQLGSTGYKKIRPSDYIKLLDSYIK